MSYQVNPWLGTLPYHVMSQLNHGDVKALLWMYERTDPIRDTGEVGVAYGGSAWLGASHARDTGRRHWLFDEFGRPGALLPGEPSMAVAFTALAVHGLERFAAWYPGTTAEARYALAPGTLGALFVDGNHTAFWARQDAEFAAHVLAPWGLVAWHDIAHLDANPEYAAYTAEVRSDMAQRGWGMVFADGCIEVYQKGGG